MEIVLVYIFYIITVAVALYYYTLFSSKDQYTRDELKDVLPFLIDFFRKFFLSGSFTGIFLILIISSLIGMIIPAISNHWISNSVIFSLILFFAMPIVKNHYEQIQVSTSESYSDTIVNVFVKYSLTITAGFIAGYGSMLVYNWAKVPEISFLWFLPNIIANSILLGLTIKKI